MTSAFGNFLRFYVQQARHELPSAENPPLRRNAFELMMCAQAERASVVLPRKVQVRNKKDELFNDILQLIEKEGLVWKASEVDNGTSSNAISTLRDALWYIDGHHQTLSDRSCHVPHIFAGFTEYNNPERSKHKKRSSSPLCADTLKSHSQRLFGNLQRPFWSRSGWNVLKAEVELLAKALAKYADCLCAKKARITSLHASCVPARTVGNALTVEYISTRLTVPNELDAFSAAVSSAGFNVAVDIDSLLPSDRRQRYDRIQLLKQGMSSPAILATYAPGGNVCSLHWLWLTDATEISSALQSCQPILETLKASLPEYHTRAMRRAMFEKFGLVTKNVKKSVLRHFYRDLTGDCATSPSISEKEVDERLSALFELEEPDLIYDLRDANPGNQSNRYSVFWSTAKTFLEEDIGTAVDDRRHSQTVHVAKAISVRDFKQQVEQRCPPETPIPCDELVRLQFVPAHKCYRSASKYTSFLEVKKQVQQRQWRKDHEDTHYAACIFRYMREYAILFHRFSVFACLDDKHKVKVGEPGFPVAAAERGRQVLVHSSTSFEVGDHDFTKSSITPSVTFLVDIPDDIAGSWYAGQVHVLYKDTIFEPSSPSRHGTEIVSILGERAIDYPVLFMYTDGGPDHRLTYASVKLTLIAVFRKLDLDYLCASRTAPHHSFRNPAERVMSILNLGMQSVGLARRQLDEEVEAELQRCTSMSQIRELALKKPSIKESLLDAVSPVKVTLSDITQRLELKGNKFSVGTAASEAEINDLWTQLKEIDPEFDLSPTDSIPRKKITPNLQAFLKHCCRERHYVFDIKKCGNAACTICKPPRLPLDHFSKLAHFPDPMPGEDGHYKKFEEVLATDTVEEHRPSLQKITKKRLPFYPSVQHVRNCNTMLLCDECGMWRLVYANRKLKAAEIRKLRGTLDDLSFSCGADLQEAGLPSELDGVVYVKKMYCNEPIERLYYSANFDDICVYCAGDVPPWSNTEEFYPQCDDCADKPPIANVKKA